MPPTECSVHAFTRSEGHPYLSMLLYIVLTRRVLHVPHVLHYEGTVNTKLVTPEYSPWGIVLLYICILFGMDVVVLA